MASVADNIRGKKPWTSLSSTEQRAAEDAGYNQRSWTTEIGPTNTPPPSGGGRSNLRHVCKIRKTSYRKGT